MVFNHKHLYANKQDGDPELISYLLRDEARWAEFPVAAWVRVALLQQSDAFLLISRHAPSSFYRDTGSLLLFD